MEVEAINPLRFGLKYAPVPTLALEYTETSPVESEEVTEPKLLLVEIPEVKNSTDEILRTLQTQHHALSSSIVNEKQLRRLIEKLRFQVREIESNPVPKSPPKDQDTPGQEPEQIPQSNQEPAAKEPVSESVPISSDSSEKEAKDADERLAQKDDAPDDVPASTNDTPSPAQDTEEEEEAEELEESIAEISEEFISEEEMEYFSDEAGSNDSF